MVRLLAFAVLTLSMMPTAATAQTKSPIARKDTAKSATQDTAAQNPRGQGDVPGDTLPRYGFGFGLGATFLGGHEVKAAIVENGLVRVTQEERVRVSAWLTTQYLFDRFPIGLYTSHGPFVAAEVGSDVNVIHSLAAGYMISWKRTALTDPKHHSALNLGVGVAVTHIQKLGSGLEEDAPLPEGVESIRYKTTSSISLLVLFSFTVL